MQSYSIREVVEMAVRTEKLGHAFYTEMAERFEDAQGLKDLFTMLATMELKHERIFTDILAKISDNEPSGWDEALHYLRAMMESQFFLGKDKSLPNFDNIKSVLEATDFALGFEKETTLFFTGLKTAVTESDRPHVQEIIDEEIKHIAMLTKFRGTL